MDELLNRLGALLLGRVEGPLHFRLLLQPVVAILLAFKAGIADAKAGRTPYFWSLFSEPGQRRKRLREGWKSVSKVFLLAFVLDIVYQFLELPRLYPFHALIIAVTLAIVPYLLLRGLVTRISTAAGVKWKHE